MMTGHDLRPKRAAEWVYQGIWRALSERFYVPHDPPTLPTASDEALEAMKPARGFLRLQKLRFWFITVLVGLAQLIPQVFFLFQADGLGDILKFSALLAVLMALIFPIACLVIYIAIHLQYDATWYVMSERSLRIRRGIWIIREMTFTFENVQNVKVKQGPLQRLLGISDLIVETAGSGGGSGNDASGGKSAMNQGRVEGVTDAWALRDRILPKLRASQSAGFGDEPKPKHLSGDTPGPGITWTAEHNQTLRAIRDELQAMAG